MSKALALKKQNLALRKGRVRAKISGTAERPRLTVTISNLHVSAQIIDDVAQKTLVSATTVGSKAKGTKTELAAKIGTEIAKKAKKYTDEQKLIAYLARQGFSFDEIKKAISKEQF